MNNQHLIAAIWDVNIPDPTTKYVLLAIARNATKDGIACSSVEKIVTSTALDKIDVYKSILELQTNGWVTIQRGPDSLIQPPSEPNEYLTRIVSEAESNDPNLIGIEVSHEVWFFCINKQPRQERHRQAAFG